MEELLCHNTNRERQAASRITLIYLLVGGLWVFFTNEMLRLLVDDPSALTRLQVLQGWFYVLVTAGMLQLLMRRSMGMLRGSKDALDERKARLRALVSGFDGYIYVTSCDHQIEFMNEHMTKSVGHDAIGECCYEALYERSTPCPWCSQEQVFNQQTIRKEMQNPRDYRWFYNVSTPLRHANGTASCMTTLLDITERKTAEKALLASEARNRAILNAIPDLMFQINRDGIFLNYHAAREETLYQPGETFVGRNVAEIVPADLAQLTMEHVHKALETGDVQIFEYHITRDNDRQEYFEARLVPSGKDQVLALCRDITHEVALEKQFLQAQRMESVGRLAGGIAHDFNNLLISILGVSQLILDDIDESHPIHNDVRNIMHAGESAAELTRQLLALGRKQEKELVPLDLDEVVTSMEPLLRHALGTTVKCITKTRGEKAVIRADHGQIEQILMNLAVNAGDAMPEGGKFTIETGQAMLDDFYCRTHPEVDPGEYLVLRVCDSGTGMPEHVRQQAFEPFFSTKEKDKGSGLGLATVYGIVQQHGGCIELQSKAGVGTEFHIYFPRIDNVVPDKNLHAV